MEITSDEALELALELLERCSDKKGIDCLNYCREIIVEGSRAMKAASHSVSLREAIEVSLREREGRRQSTLRELRYLCKKLLESSTGIASMKLRSIEVNHCNEVLSAFARTPRQFSKIRIVLHSIFACGIRHGWCSSNPIAAIPKPRLKEREIVPLAWEKIERLLCAVRQPTHRCLAPVLGLMLWAGMRPAEVQRVQWEDINWEEGIILLSAQHSKTGGARCITLQPVLKRWLVRVCGGKKLKGTICPKSWNNRWRRLRHDAGVEEWQQDVLRHTFASYHLKHFRNLSQLQIEMGHSTPDLLRIRYLNMSGITKEHARVFWSSRKWC